MSLVEQMILVAAGAAWHRATRTQLFTLAWAIVPLFEKYPEPMIQGAVMDDLENRQ